MSARHDLACAHQTVCGSHVTSPTTAYSLLVWVVLGHGTPKAGNVGLACRSLDRVGDSSPFLATTHTNLAKHTYLSLNPKPWMHPSYPRGITLPRVLTFSPIRRVDTN